MGGLTLLAVVTGALLSLSRPVSASASLTSALQIALWVISIPTLAYAVSVALDAPRPWRLLGAALVVGMMSNRIYFGATADNWKYLYGYSVIALGLLLVGRSAFRVVIALSIFGVASLIASSRSLALMLFIASLTVLASRVRFLSSPMKRIVTYAAAAVLASLALSLAMGSGFLGPGLQKTYVAQTIQGESLIAGGRVESQVTLQLARERWQGYGLGVRVDQGVMRSALDAARAVGGDVSSPYFKSVILGSRTDLHSGVSNLWFYCGVTGLLLAILLSSTLIRGLGSDALMRQSSGATFSFLIWFAAWDLLFSPIQSTDHVCLGLGISLWLLRQRGYSQFDVMSGAELGVHAARRAAPGLQT